MTEFLMTHVASRCFSVFLLLLPVMGQEWWTEKRRTKKNNYASKTRSTVPHRHQPRTSPFFYIFATYSSSEMRYMDPIPISTVWLVQFQCNACNAGKDSCVLLVFRWGAALIFDLGPWNSLFLATSSEVAWRSLIAKYHTEEAVLSTREHFLLSTVRSTQLDRHGKEGSTERNRKETRSFSSFSSLLPSVSYSTRCSSGQRNIFGAYHRFLRVTLKHKKQQPLNRHETVST